MNCVNFVFLFFVAFLAWIPGSPNTGVAQARDTIFGHDVSEDIVNNTSVKKEYFGTNYNFNLTDANFEEGRKFKVGNKRRIHKHKKHHKHKSHKKNSDEKDENTSE